MYNAQLCTKIGNILPFLLVSDRRANAEIRLVRAPPSVTPACYRAPTGERLDGPTVNSPVHCITGA